MEDRKRTIWRIVGGIVTALAVAAGLCGSDSEVPDGFEGFRIVRAVSFSDPIGLSAEWLVILDPPATETGPK